MDAARDLFRRAQPSNGSLAVDGKALTSERVEARDPDGVHRARLHRRRVHRLARRAVRDRARHGLRRHQGGRADRDRPLAEGRRDRVLRRHDALVLHRRRSRSVARLSPCCEGVAGRSIAALKAGVKGSEVNAVSCEPFHAAGRDAARQDPGEILDTGFFHSLGHGVGLESARAAEPVAHRRRARRRRRRHGRAGDVQLAAGAAAGSRISCSSRRAAPRRPHRISVRPRALGPTHTWARSRRCSWRNGATRRLRNSPRRRTRSPRSTSATPTSSGRAGRERVTWFEPFRRSRMGASLREVVRRRQDERDLQLRRPACQDRRRRQGCVHLGRRASRRPARAHVSPTSATRRRSRTR